MQPFRIVIDPGHGGRDPGTVAGEAKKSLGVESFELLAFFFNFIASF